MSKLYGCCEGLREPDWSRVLSARGFGLQKERGRAEGDGKRRRGRVFYGLRTVSGL